MFLIHIGVIFFAQYSLGDEGQKNWDHGLGEIILLDYMVQCHQRAIKAWNNFDLLFTLEKEEADRSEVQTSNCTKYYPETFAKTVVHL